MTAREQLRKSLSRFPPEVADVAHAVLRHLDREVPGATRFLYDKANAVVVGYGPNERPSDAVLSIGVYRRWVNLYFLDGAELEDRDKLLMGSGNRVRFIRVQQAQDLEIPGVRVLMQQAVDRAEPRIPSSPRGRLVVRAVSAARR